MSFICVFDFIHLAPYVILLVFGWLFFFKLNSAIVLIKPEVSDKRNSKTNTLKKVHFSIFIKLSIVLFFFLILNLSTIHCYNSTFFFDHLILNQFFYKFQIFFYSLVLLVMCIFYLVSFNKISINIDFFFAVYNIMAFLPLIFISNTFFTFFFILEVSSCLIFYKFVTARFYYKNIVNFGNFKSLEKFNKNLPKNFLNVLFFQYWVTFFSSVLIILFLIQFIFIFGSSE